MEIAQIIWLIICGIVIIAGFSLGSYYLGEWKEACVNYARYAAKFKKGDRSSDNYYESDIAENLVKKQICFPIWTVSFVSVIIFLGIVAWTLFT